MSQLFSNNASTTLNGGITNTATSLMVTSTTNFPVIATTGDYFYITITDNVANWEILQVTATSSTTFTVVRGVDNTTALTWSSGAIVEVRPVAQELRDINSLSSQLATSTTTSQGAGLVGYNSALTYTANTVGAGIGGIYDNLSSSSLGEGDALIEVIQPWIGAIARTQHQKNTDSITTTDFGAKGDGITNDTIAIQAAINYALTNNKNVEVIGLSYITSSLIINRTVNNQTNTFTIFSGGNGQGFLVATGITLFSSNSVAGGTGVITAGNFVIGAQYIIYSIGTTSFTSIGASANQVGLQFTATGIGSGTGTAYMNYTSDRVKFFNLQFQPYTITDASTFVINDQFLHVQFESCHFQSMKCVNSPIYLESWYFLNNHIQSWQNGYFVNCAGCYDISFIGNCVEGNLAAGGYFFQSYNSWSAWNAVGVRFFGNLIEGLSGSAISVDGAQGLTISGNYFERNGTTSIPNINLMPGTLSHTGIVISGNCFEANIGYPTAWNILWGSTSDAVSFSNYCAGNLHDNSNVSAPNLSITSFNESAGNTLWRVARGNLIIAMNAQQSSSGSGAGPFTPACERYSYYQYAISSSTVTINAPTGGVNGQQLIIQLYNNSGSSITSVTFASIYKVQAWTSLPANYTCNITFLFDGANWREIVRSGAIPN